MKVPCGLRWDLQSFYYTIFKDLSCVNGLKAECLIKLSNRSPKPPFTSCNEKTLISLNFMTNLQDLTQML